MSRELCDIVANFENPIDQVAYACDALMDIADSMNYDGHARSVWFVARALQREGEDLRRIFNEASKALHHRRRAAPSRTPAASKPPKDKPKLMLVKNSTA